MKIYIREKVNMKFFRKYINIVCKCFSSGVLEFQIPASRSFCKTEHFSS